MEYSKLYKRDSKGKIRVWWINQHQNRYSINSGLLDGEIVTTDELEVFGKNKGKKNETSDFEQTIKDIQSRYDKQRKTGYFDKVSDVDNNTYIQPMLAKNYNDYKTKIKIEHCILQYKYNGGRCIITKDGAFTRKGEIYHTIPHILNSLKHFFSAYPNAVLDGELYNHEFKHQLNELMKLVRDSVHITEETLRLSREKVKFYIYDCYVDNQMKSQPYIDRKQFIDERLNYDYVIPVPSFPGSSIEQTYKNALDQGYEGVMIRQNMPYENKRSQYLLKYKPMDDAEFTITSIKEGHGDWAGKAKVIGLTNGEYEFDASFKGSMEEAEACLKNKDSFIGKVATIYYFGYTGLGTPNYAQFDYNNWRKD